MNKAAFLAALVIIMSLFSGCFNNEDDSSIVEGQSVSGGDRQLEQNINLKDIDIQMQGADTVINMSFINGSLAAGASEAMISSVPPYKVSVLHAPIRIGVELDIDYFDYSGESGLFTDSVISGTFRVAPKGADTVTVYFQLNDGVAVRIEENDAVLSLILTPLNETGRNAYFAALDAFQEYESGLLPENIGLTPTMGNALTDVILISEPYHSMSEAESAAQAINEAAGGVTQNSAYAFVMETSALPVIERQTGDNLVSEQPVFEINGSSETLPVLLENGRILTITNEKDIIYARPFLQTGEENENVQKEEVWILRQDGSDKKMALPDFYGVEQAAVSADGRYLALLEGGVNDKVLYAYDFSTGDLLNLGEEGFGDNTSSFVWDESQNVIYAMTGYGKWQLLRYDFSRPEAQRVSSVEEKNGTESKVAIAGGELYFVDGTEGETGGIYSVNISTSERVRIADGVEFELSPDGRYLAASTIVALDEESRAFNIELIDLSGAEETITVAENLNEGNYYAFGTGSDKLYYSTQNQQDASNEYPFAFYLYDISGGKTKLLGASKSAMFMPGDDDGELYIIDYFEMDSHNFPITYVYEDG